MAGHEAESSRTVIIHDHFGGVDPGPGADVAVLGTDGPSPPPPTATGAIRVGDWKLLVGVQRFATWFGQFSPNMTGPSNASNTQACANGPCLFNIKNDTTEHHDLAAAMPGKVSEMLKIFNSYNKKFHAGGSVEMAVLVIIRLARAHACARARVDCALFAIWCVRTMLNDGAGQKHRSYVPPPVRLLRHAPAAKHWHVCPASPT